MSDYNKNFDYDYDDYYDCDAEDEDSVCYETFMYGWNYDEEEDREKYLRGNQHIIATVFSDVGQTMSKQEAMRELTSLIPMDENKDKKAAGALGGAVANGFLSRNGDFFTRIR